MNNFSPSHNQNVCSYDHVFELLNPYQTTVIFHTPKKHQKIRSFMEFSGCTGTIGAKWVKESLSLWHAILLCSNFYTFLMLYSDWRTTIKIMLVGCFVSPLSFLFTFFSYLFFMINAYYWYMRKNLHKYRAIICYFLLNFLFVPLYFTQN